MFTWVARVVSPRLPCRYLVEGVLAANMRKKTEKQSVSGGNPVQNVHPGFVLCFPLFGARLVHFYRQNKAQSFFLPTPLFHCSPVFCFKAFCVFSLKFTFSIGVRCGTRIRPPFFPRNTRLFLVILNRSFFHVCFLNII